MNDALIGNNANRNYANGFKSDSVQDIKLTVNGDGTFVFNGESPKNIRYDIETVPKGTYVFKRRVISGESTSAVVLRYSSENVPETTWPDGTEITLHEDTAVRLRAGAGMYRNYVVELLLCGAEKPVAAAASAAVPAAATVTGKSLTAAPEQFGAYGDGVHDDTEAVNRAINASNDILLNQNYLIKDSLTISDNKRVVINGSVHYAGKGAAVILSGRNIVISGCGNIVSNGAYGFYTESLINSDISLRGGITCSKDPNGSAVYFNGTRPIYRNYFHDMHLVGGTKDNLTATGIFLKPTETSYVNENTFERIAIIHCAQAITVNNASGVSRCDGNAFLRIDASTSDVQLYTIGGQYDVSGNVFEFRSDEYSNRIGKFILNNFTLNRLIFNNRIRPQIFTQSERKARTMYVSNVPAPNQIIGFLVGNSVNGLITSNPTLMMNGEVPVFNYRAGRTVSDAIEGDENHRFRFSWDNPVTCMPGMEIYEITAGQLTFDLNYISDWYNCPLQHLEIKNESGCNLQIVNDDRILMPDNHLDPGLYRAVYTPEKNGIRLIKLG